MVDLFTPTGPPSVQSVPDGMTVYAVGDIHGRLDLLLQIQDRIRADADRRAAEDLRLVVYLGDYVDRGPASRGVIDHLLQGFDGFECLYLRGNHEDMTLRFIDDPTQGTIWQLNGGRETLESYGVVLPDPPVNEADMAEAHGRLMELLPSEHATFLRQLDLSRSVGDYYFVHAGVRPNVGLTAQTPGDQLWIRSEFLGSRQNFGKLVVHGHTIVDAPQLLPNRIALDTGAFLTGRLTALVLRKSQRDLLQTGTQRNE